MNELETAKRVAREAGEAVLSFYGGEYVVNGKDVGGQEEPVTEADLVSNKTILKELKRFNYGILSEETNEDNGRFEREKVWIVDPLDGTSDFVKKTGEFSIAIGLAERGRPILGVVYWPMKDKLYWAITGKGAYLEEGNKSPVRLTVSKKENPTGMTILVSRSHLLELEQWVAEKFQMKQLPHGSILKICLVAEGVGDIYMNTSDKTGEWDTCAPEVIIREAGGKITDMDSKDLEYNKKNPKNLNGFVVTNGVVHELILESLKEARD